MRYFRYPTHSHTSDSEFSVEGFVLHRLVEPDAATAKSADPSSATSPERSTANSTPFTPPGNRPDPTLPGQADPYPEEEHTKVLLSTPASTDGRGSLAVSAPLEASRHEAAWDGDTNILVDAMTYSAAEDFLHSSVGQANTQIHGGPTGGGSGRPHTRALLDGFRLSVSTAITYTRDGRAIEFHGIG